MKSGIKHQKQAWVFAAAAFFGFLSVAYAGPCYDGICDETESPDTCPWDCRIASLDKEIKIQYPVYTVTRVTHYKLDGNKEEIVSNPSKILEFLVSKIDMAVAGGVSGSKIRMDQVPAYQGVVLPYKQLNSVITTDKPVFDLVSSDENAFVHARGMAMSPENRLLLRCVPSQILMDPRSRWREYYSSYILGLIAANPRWDGVFIDNALGRLNTSGRYVREIKLEPRVVSSDGKTIVFADGVQLHVPAPYYTCENTIQAYDNAAGIGADLYSGGSYSATSVVLGTPVAPNSTVYLSYTRMDLPDQTVIDEWPQATFDTIQHIKKALGNKLLIYNGIVESWTEDDLFPSITDGGMIEHFLYAPWGVPSAPVTENRWLIFMKELDTTSRDKTFLAQSGILLDTGVPSNETTMKRIAMYCFASYLLGKHTYAYFNFSVGPNTYQHYRHFDYWELPIGKALENYRKNDTDPRLYERRFENAMAVVNAGDKTASLKTPDGYLSFIDGLGHERPIRVAGTLITMEPNSGLLFMKSTGTIAGISAFDEDVVRFGKFKNSFNPAAGEKLLIEFDCLSERTVRLAVYDRAGNEVIELLNENVLPSKQTKAWDGRNQQGSLVASGLYVIALESGDKFKRTKAVVIK